MRILPKPLKLIAFYLFMYFMLNGCLPNETTEFIVEIETECHNESTSSYYWVSSKEYQRITSYLHSYDPNYYNSGECIHITIKTKNGVNESEYFVSHSATD